MSTELDRLAVLFGYPESGYHSRVASGGADLDEFASAIAALSITELEELYTRVFDLNPDASLDIGWHLFGEDYARGEFLVHLRQKARQHGLPETAELPDHLTRVLPLMARLPESEAAEFAGKFVLPALGKIARAAADAGSPYSTLVAVAQKILETKLNVEVAR